MQRIEKFRVEYTRNGADWMDYNDKEILDGNTDQDTIVTVDLEPFEALSVKIVPTAWN